MAVLNDCLAKGDYDGAIRTIEEIKSSDTPIIASNVINTSANAFADENDKSVSEALQSTSQPIATPTQPPQQTQATPVPQRTQLAKPPEAAATLFTNV